MIESYHFEVLPDEPIMIAYVHSDFSTAHEMKPAFNEARKVLTSLGYSVFYILDLSEVKLDINDVVAGSNQGSRGEDPLWHHPMIREFIITSPSKLIQLAAAGLNSVSFGNLDVKVFNNMDEALAYCREKIRSE